jgi:peptide/nickel transport system substrate-binding protein
MRPALWLGVIATILIGGRLAPAVAESGVLRVAVPQLPPALDPATALEGPVPLIARQVFDTLVQYVDGGTDVEPGLAIQWSASRDGLVWTFKLREGVLFHDGTLLAAQHVVESLGREILPGHARAPNGSVAGQLLRGTPGVVRQIRARDSRTIEIALSQPYAPLLTVLAHPAFSIVLPSLAPDGSVAKWLGTGPFTLAEIGADRIVLDATSGHWRRGPRLQRIVLTAAPDEARAEAALGAQELDVIFPAGPPVRVDRAASIPGWRVGYLALQTEKAPFNRVKVRRAVATALDPGPIALVLGKAATPLQTFLPRGVGGRRDAPSLMGGDPERARKLLAEAGLATGTSVSLMVGDLDPSIDRLKLATAIGTSLRAAGLTVTVRQEPWDAVRSLVQAGEHQLVLAEGKVEAGDPHFLLYPLSASEGAVKGSTAVNYSFYRNTRLDDLLIRASQLSFRPERDRLYLRAQTTLAEEMPWIPIYARNHWVVVRPEVKDLRLHPSGNPRLDRVWIEPGAAAPSTSGPSGR